MKIGFIGLGIMGESMCENIVKKHDDTVYCFDFIPAKVELLASKGAAGVTGSGFVTLAATLATIPTIPVAGIALILGVDRFMSEARALTNLVGNSVATIVVAKWEGALDMQRLHAELDQPTVIEEEPFLPDDGLLQPVPADK